MPFKQNKDGSYTSDRNGKLKIPTGNVKWPTPPGGVHKTPSGETIPMKNGKFDSDAWDRTHGNGK